jgi:phosphatidylglycerol:prolipoprotein diacylglycerol transferase
VTSGDDIIGSAAFVDQMQKGIIPATATATTPLLPTQLFESAGALVIFAVMLVMRRYRKVYGEQIALIFMLYPIVRFTVEFFRGDHGPSFWGLTIPQVFSVTAFAAGAAGLAYLRLRRPRGLVIGEGD